MNDLQERLDGIQRWFYGGEPGLDDLPPEDDGCPRPAEERCSALDLCNACAQALQA